MNHFSYAIAAKHVAAGALLTDVRGQVLLVNPTYKPEWEIPGGLVEENEAPRVACVREVEEEIGLRIDPGRLLSVDYRPAPPSRSDMLRFVFWGGELDEDSIAKIRLPLDELSEWGFFDVETARRLLTPSLGEVVAGCFESLLAEDTLYLEFDETVDVPQ